MKVYFLYFFRSQLQLTTSMITLLSLLIRPKTLKLARPLDLEVTWSRFLHRMRIWVLPAKLCTISRTETQMVKSYYHKHSCLVAILTSLKHRSRKLHASTVTQHAFFQQQTLPISSGILVLFFGMSYNEYFHCCYYCSPCFQTCYYRKCMAYETSSWNPWLGCLLLLFVSFMYLITVREFSVKFKKFKYKKKKLQKP